jgi:hypothetical protein
LDDGLYGFIAEPIHPSDDRYRSCSRWDLTAKVTFAAPFHLPSSGEIFLPPALSNSSSWTYKLLAGTTLQRRILVFPVADGLHFDAELRSFYDGFRAPAAPPPARRTYDLSNLIHMAYLSAHLFHGDRR